MKIYCDFSFHTKCIASAIGNCEQNIFCIEGWWCLLEWKVHLFNCPSHPVDVQNLEYIHFLFWSKQFFKHPPVFCFKTHRQTARTTLTFNRTSSHRAHHKIVLQNVYILFLCCICMNSKRISTPSRTQHLTLIYSVKKRNTRLTVSNVFLRTPLPAHLLCLLEHKIKMKISNSFSFIPSHLDKDKWMNGLGHITLITITIHIPITTPHSGRHFYIEKVWIHLILDISLFFFVLT